MDLKQIIEDVTFFSTINPTFQIQLKQHEIEFHVLTDHFLYYTVYTIPIENTTQCGYYSLNSSEWISTLNRLEGSSQIVFSVEVKFKNRLFLSAHDYPTYRQSVHIELQGGNHENILDVNRISLSENFSSVQFKSSQQLFQWTTPCQSPEAHHTELMVKSPNEFTMNVIHEENDVFCTIVYKQTSILTSGQNDQPFCIDMKLLMPFLTNLSPRPCKLIWTLGRPLELELNTDQRNILVYIAPCESVTQSSRYSEPSAEYDTISDIQVDSQSNSTKRRKKISPPPILN